MISVNPIGRLGNNLFQYTFARILSEKTGLSLSYTVGTKIINTPTVEGINIYNNELQITDFFDINRDHVLNLEEIISNCKNRRIKIFGYFQHKSYYENIRPKIKTWLGEIPLKNPEVTGIHIRKTDYIQQGWSLSNDYYNECINLSNPKKLYIFTDDPADEYVKFLISQGGELINDTPENSLYLLGTCGQQILSRSTFSWWSAFLSSSNKIYYPRPKKGWWSLADTPEKDLSINSKEYYYIEQE